MKLNKATILVTGGEGFLGKYVVRELKNLKPKRIFVPSHSKYDLTKRSDCEKVVKNIDIVIHLAAQIGGIGYIKSRPAELYYNNLIMGTELMEAARKSGVKKFVGIGTVCEYPKVTPMPFKEKNLWDGYPEETTAPYGWAKKMLIVQSKAYRDQYNFNSIHLMPVNLYGPEDNFDHESAHVIPALVKRIANARDNEDKSVEIWGSGKATREFLFVEDAARGIVLATINYDSSEPINLGSGVEVSIKKLAEYITEIVGFKGRLIWNKKMPDGQPRRQLDVSKAAKFGFKAKTKFKDGLKKTILWYKKNKTKINH